ncbi:MAG: Membrane-associated zinc metalloprotease [uncultured Thiotrichaceae bacterium]|uniref:Zinc metalloprotease n=1 Tax=uncultured Thiotrichaceae bacterium TaxID=298394 RepID=A0A6S6UG87_9GAMM|nr:MAG: Membrane-associated zinc metalloprotease [uncultured Thiotrichaceae bacterium]
MNLLIMLPAFLVTIGILVTVHEFGHYWVARKLGVKVLRFSIGFGKPLWKRVSGEDQTEYVVAALPLGGYVKMLDEREGEVAEEELHRAFNRQSVWTRIAVVAAGPIANFILAIFIYALMFGTGVPAMQPFVHANDNTPAQVAGFEAGDKILSINELPVATWEEARMLLLEEYLNSPQLTILVETPQGQQAERILNLSNAQLLKEEGDFLKESGLQFWSPEYGVRLGGLSPGGAAEAAGLKPGDTILAIDGQKMERADAFVGYVQARAGQPIDFKVQRDDGTTNVLVTPAPVLVDGKEVGRIGSGVGEFVPAHVLDKLKFTQSFGPVDSLTRGVERTWQMSVVTLKLMGRMLTGEVSLKNISGPITIARFSGETVMAGLPYYLGFLAIISISLGILNLLPIPMLDGGHLLYYIIEIIKGSPVSERVEEYGFRFGMALVACIMVLALYNDFMRLLN